MQGGGGGGGFMDMFGMMGDMMGNVVSSPVEPCPKKHTVRTLVNESCV